MSTKHGNSLSTGKQTVITFGIYPNFSIHSHAILKRKHFGSINFMTLIASIKNRFSFNLQSSVFIKERKPMEMHMSWYQRRYRLTKCSSTSGVTFNNLLFHTRSAEIASGWGRKTGNSDELLSIILCFRIVDTSWIMKIKC